jgi:hypothetical protein
MVSLYRFTPVPPRRVAFAVRLFGDAYLLRIFVIGFNHRGRKEVCHGKK